MSTFVDWYMVYRNFERQRQKGEEMSKIPVVNDVRSRRPWALFEDLLRPLVDRERLLPGDGCRISHGVFANYWNQNTQALEKVLVQRLFQTSSVWMAGLQSPYLFSFYVEIVRENGERLHVQGTLICSGGYRDTVVNYIFE